MRFRLKLILFLDIEMIEDIVIMRIHLKFEIEYFKVEIQKLEFTMSRYS